MKKRSNFFRTALSGILSLSLFSSMAFPEFPVRAESMGGQIQMEFFVSPDGDDSNDGSYEKPFATLQAARDAVREINDNMTGDIYVFIAGGKYYLDETLVFTEEDSGTNGHKIVYRNLDEIGSVELIGGKQVNTQWELVDPSGKDPAVDADADLPAAAAGKVYKTNVGKDADFHTLYVNDRRATLARTQNRDNSNGFSSALTPYMESAGGGTGDLTYKDGTIDQESLDGMVHAKERGDLNASVYMWDGGYWDWMTDTIPISNIDTGTRKLTYKTKAGHPETYRPKYATRENARYFIQGNLGFLDVPGEYYYNQATGDLYYYPEGNIADLDIVIPYVQDVIRVEGSSKDSMVENITFSGLEIKDADHTEWYAYGWNWGDAGDGLNFYPEAAEGSTQPSYCEQTERVEFQYGNITLTNTRNISIMKSHIKNSGMFGINLYLANQNALIEDCMIEYTAHGGISVDGGYPGVAGDANGDGYSRDNTIRNCIVHDIGELVGQASGITLQQSGYNTVSHVEVYNSPRRGIFLTAGHSRNYGGADAGFQSMRDLYTHHNTIEYAYLHDCQQDGGDDGAFFVCYLFGGPNNRYYGQSEYKPNYVNQMVIENIAANPSMHDIAPNGMNLDMGASGMELSNVKVVNPQHYNIEEETHTNYGDTITYNNVNIDFGTSVNHLAEFDDSLMEYDQIGVTIDFPAEYTPQAAEPEVPENVYFSEDFESGISDTKWGSKEKPEITTEWMSEGVFGGRQALKIDSDKGKPVLYREFAADLNKIVVMKMFDRGGHNSYSDFFAGYSSGVQIKKEITTYGRADNGINVVAMGIDNNVGGQKTYVVDVNGNKEALNIERCFGWHELKWDYTSGTDVKLYFDGKLVKTLTEADGVSTSFKYVSMGSETGSGVSYYDELNIYGGTEAEAPGDIEAALPEIPARSEVEENKQELYLDFQDGELPPFTFTVEDTSRLTQEIIDEEGNKVLKHYSGDGHAFYETGKQEFKNYLMNCKWKFGGFGDKNVLDFAYDNFTFYVMTNLDGDDRPTNPGSYQVVLRRNLNGGNGFDPEVPYFEVCKHLKSGDSSLARAALPEGFDLNAWHDVQIQTFNGKVGLIIDGTTILSAEDGDYTYGGIGFGGINATSYLDDIEIITNPTNVKYDDNLGLTNIEINGAFNPDHYEYYVKVADNAQPVTFIMPEGITPEADVSATINGAEITEANAQPVELALHNGTNDLLITEHGAVDKTYTVHINKAVAVSGIGEVASAASTEVGRAPQLQATVTVTYSDGSTEDAAIIWKMVSPALYKRSGSFPAHGTVAGTQQSVSTTVTVSGLESVSGLPEVTTSVGVAPTLASSVTAQYTDGARELPISFADFAKELYSKMGTIIAVGSAEGYAGDILQVVKVEKGSMTDTTNPADNACQGSLENEVADLADAVLTADEIERFKNGEPVKIYLEVKDISENVSEADKKLVEEKSEGEKIGLYLDVNLFKQIGTDDKQKVVRTSGKITIRVEVPEELINKDSSIERKYGVIRVHNEKAEILQSTFHADNRGLTFETDAFSTYALVYKDTQKEENGGAEDPSSPSTPSFPNVPESGSTSINIGRCKVTLSENRYTYDGKAKTPEVMVRDGANVLMPGTDYTASYSNNTNAGAASVTVSGAGDYTGEQTVRFTISKASNVITAANINKTASSKTRKLSIGAKDLAHADLSYKSNNKSVKVSKTGTVTIAKNFVGSAVIAITAADTGNYAKAVKKIKVTVKPAGVKLVGIKSINGNKMQVRWKKGAGITGYQIQYSTSKDFKKGAKTVTVPKKTSTSATIAKIKEGKKYYVRIRAYKKVSGKTYYSEWSRVKTAAVKA